MGIDSWTYHSTYRGIVIQEYTRSSTGWTDYTAYTDQWVMGSLSAVKSKIDEYLYVEPEPEPEPEPDHWEYHSTYRGIDIQVWMPDGTPYTAYFAGKWYTAASLSTLKARIDTWLEPEPEPEPEPKKPTTVSIDVYPTSGTPPYDVMITASLTSNGVAIPYKFVSIYKNDSLLTSGNTDSGGKLERTDTVMAESSYYAYFAGDSEYEGCSSDGEVPPPGVGLGGVGLLVLLLLILEGGK